MPVRRDPCLSPSRIAHERGHESDGLRSDIRGRRPNPSNDRDAAGMNSAPTTTIGRWIASELLRSEQCDVSISFDGQRALPWSPSRLTHRAPGQSSGPQRGCVGRRGRGGGRRRLSEGGRAGGGRGPGAVSANTTGKKKRGQVAPPPSKRPPDRRYCAATKVGSSVGLLTTEAYDQKAPPGVLVLTTAKPTSVASVNTRFSCRCS